MNNRRLFLKRGGIAILGLGIAGIPEFARAAVLDQKRIAGNKIKLRYHLPEINLNHLKRMTCTCCFAPVHSNIVVLKNSLVLHLSGQNVLTAYFG
jgi:hypothetical protein